MYLNVLRAEVWPGLCSALKQLRLANKEISVGAGCTLHQPGGHPRAQPAGQDDGRYLRRGDPDSVLAWQRVARDYSAVSVLQNLDDVFNRRCESDLLAPQDDTDRTGNDIVELVLQHTSRSQEQACRDLWALLGRPWCERKWIIQGPVKSKRRVLVASAKRRESKPRQQSRCSPANDHRESRCR